MSYDLSIRYDEDFSQSAELGSFESWVLSDPRVRRNGDSSFVFESLPKNLWVELDVETCGDGEEVTFNCIRVHIPYGTFDSTPDEECFTFLHGICSYLGWQVVDEQVGDDG